MNFNYSRFDFLQIFKQLTTNQLCIIVKNNKFLL